MICNKLKIHKIKIKMMNQTEINKLVKPNRRNFVPKNKMNLTRRTFKISLSIIIMKNKTKRFYIFIYIFIHILRILYYKLQKKKKIIILGLSRTGTTSICSYLSKVNNRVWHFTPNYKLIRLLGYNAIGDIPYFRRNISESDIEKDTKYILTVRDPIKWEKSMIKFAYNTWNIKKNQKQPFFSKTMKIGGLFHHFPINFLNNIIHNFNKEYPEFHSDNLKDVMDKHTKHIKNVFANNKDQLLIIDVTDDDKEMIKNKINDFLNLSVPTKNIKFENIKYDDFALKQFINLFFFI